MNDKATSSNLSGVDSAKRIQPAKDVIARKNQDGTVIVMRLDESSVFFKIDGIAAEVWSALDQQKSTNEIISEVKSKHPNFHTQLDLDIPKFISELMNKNLLTYC